MSVPKSIGGRMATFAICVVFATLFTSLSWDGWLSAVAAYFLAGVGFYAKAIEESAT